MRVTGKLEYYGRSGLGTNPLERTFFRYTNATGLLKYALTDTSGNVDIDATVDASGVADLVVMAHNPVVRVLESTANPLTIATERGGAPVSVRIGLTPGATVPVDTDVTPSIHFHVAGGLRQRYEDGLREFPPWNHEFPIGYSNTPDENKQIDALIRGQLDDLLPFVRPYPLNPTIHFTSTAFALQHEIGHALHFLKISEDKRARILANYIPFLMGITGGPYHNLHQSTNEFVAFVEAFGYFSEAYFDSKRAPGAPIAGSPPAAFHAHFYNYLRNRIIIANWGRYPIPPPPAPATPHLPTPAPPNVHVGGSEPWSSGSPATVEGAICAALFVDYAGRPGIGLPFVVETYVRSEALTFREYATYILNRFTRYSLQYNELAAAATPWGIPMPEPAGVRTPYTHYLRAPIKPDGIAADTVTVTEAPPARDPRREDPCPQAIEIRFARPTGSNRAVEIAPAFEGWLAFLPADTLRPGDLPASAAESRRPTFISRGWKPVGVLVLASQTAPQAAALKRHVTLLGEAPQIARYTPTQLTDEFLFQTLAQAARVSLDSGYTGPAAGVPGGVEQLVFDFVHGRARLFCALGATPADDTASLRMPIVADSGTGSSDLRLEFSLSARVAAVTTAAWFGPRPEDTVGITDTSGTSIAGAALVPAALNNPIDLAFNPRHPGHAIVPPVMVFAQANADAWVDSDFSNPVRLRALQPLSGNRRYRRFVVRRIPIPEQVDSDDERRQFPMYQLIVRQGSSVIHTSRLSLSGEVYLPLAEGTYHVEAIPRGLPPSTANSGAGDLRFSIKPVLPNRFWSRPAPSINIAVGFVDAEVELYVALRKYDGRRIWNRLRELEAATVLEGSRRFVAGKLNLRAMPVSGSAVDIPSPLVAITSHDPAHDAVLGFIRQSAAAHLLAPELLYAVFFGGALGARLAAAQAASTVFAFDPNALIPGADIGLYSIGDGLPGHSVTGVTADIGLVQLIADGYLDGSAYSPGILANVAAISSGAGTGHVGADIRGWEAAIEIVAAQLQARLDVMVNEYRTGPSGSGPPNPCGADGSALDSRRALTPTEDMQRFLAVARYLGERDAITWQTVAHFLGCYLDASGALRPWSVTDGSGTLRYPSAPPATPFSELESLWFNTLRYLAVAAAVEDAGAFR